jgi:hypothetical protein
MHVYITASRIETNSIILTYMSISDFKQRLS